VQATAERKDAWMAVNISNPDESKRKQTLCPQGAQIMYVIDPNGEGAGKYKRRIVAYRVTMPRAMIWPWHDGTLKIYVQWGRLGMVEGG